MTLQSSGQISLNDVNVELGNSGTAQISMNDSGVRGLFERSSDNISMSHGHGKSSEFPVTIGSSSSSTTDLSTLAAAAGAPMGGYVVFTINPGVTLTSSGPAYYPALTQGSSGWLSGARVKVINYGTVLGYNGVTGQSSPGQGGNGGTGAPGFSGNAPSTPGTAGTTAQSSQSINFLASGGKAVEQIGSYPFEWNEHGTTTGGTSQNYTLTAGGGGGGGGGNANVHSPASGLTYAGGAGGGGAAGGQGGASTGGGSGSNAGGTSGGSGRQGQGWGGDGGNGGNPGQAGDPGENTNDPLSYGYTHGFSPGGAAGSGTGTGYWAGYTTFSGNITHT